MDISDINKVANRKRINTDAEKLREKVSRETAKIIKLKVAQDTAYWDLKEKLHQVEGNHERLRQNMVEVQMQHEAVSGRYQEELRLRPDTLNRLSGARGVCDVLEAYTARLRGAVARCRADQQALSAAYAECGRRVRNSAADALAQRTAAATDIRRAHTNARHTQQQLVQVTSQLARREVELQRAAEERSTLGEEVARVVRALDAERAEAQRTVLLYEQRVREAREQGSQQARAVAERQLHDVERQARDRDALLQGAVRENDELKLKMATLEEIKRDLETALENKDRDIEALQTEVASFKENIALLEKEKSEAKQKVAELLEDSETKTTKIDKMSQNIKDLENKMAELEISLKSEREESSQCRAALSAGAAELDAKAGAIASLMGELRTEAEARRRADANLQAARTQLEEQQQRSTALGERVQRLDADLRDKDDELARQMKIILEVRTEKERLQEKIRGMEGTIDNIQKELTGRGPAPRPPADLPHRDTDALYGFLSDTSVDDALDPREVGRRFAALAGGKRGPEAAISLSQLKVKNRAFFKSKRPDAKVRKLK